MKTRTGMEQQIVVGIGLVRLAGFLVGHGQLFDDPQLRGIIQTVTDTADLQGFLPGLGCLPVVAIVGLTRRKIAPCLDQGRIVYAPFAPQLVQALACALHIPYRPRRFLIGGTGAEWHGEGTGQHQAEKKPSVPVETCHKGPDPVYLQFQSMTTLTV
jgi:hypothetical protein